jgi:PHS family inorganic phosphate transporter-like MFS transporter
MMGCVYYKDYENTVPIYIDTSIKAASHIGILIGQIVYGVASDKLGRKRVYGTELLVIVVAGCASAMSGSTVSGMSVFTQLFIWRFFLGIGIGGDYPLSATITSESSKTKHRGAMMAAVKC